MVRLLVLYRWAHAHSCSGCCTSKYVRHLHGLTPLQIHKLISKCIGHLISTHRIFTCAIWCWQLQSRNIYLVLSFNRMIQRINLLIIVISLLHGLRWSIGHCHLGRTIEKPIFHVSWRLQFLLLPWRSRVAHIDEFLVIRHGSLAYLVLLYSVGHNLKGVLEVWAERIHFGVVDAYSPIWRISRGTSLRLGRAHVTLGEFAPLGAEGLAWKRGLGCKGAILIIAITSISIWVFIRRWLCHQRHRT